MAGTRSIDPTAVSAQNLRFQGLEATTFQWLRATKAAIQGARDHPHPPLPRDNEKSCLKWGKKSSLTSRCGNCFRSCRSRPNLGRPGHDEKGFTFQQRLSLLPLSWSSFSGSFYTVDQTEQVIITQFGKPVGDPITEPGLHFKPLVQSVNSLDKRFLEWDGTPVAIPTRDKTYIQVVTFARWRIEDPKTYFVRLHD
jgi:hypothetical protein